MATIHATQAIMTKKKNAQMQINQDKLRKYGSGFAAGAAMIAEKDGANMTPEDMGAAPMIKLGDASIASSFTYKKASIVCAIEVIRQGRCTLVTTLQMYQILALNCLISSYSLSVLYLDGVKYGDKQMTCMGVLMSISFLSISRAKTMPKLSSVRPLNSIFHPAMFISLLGQFTIHLCCMMYTVSIAKPFLPVDYEPSHTGKFEPNLINSVVFLVTCIQQVSNHTNGVRFDCICTNHIKLYIYIYALKVKVGII